MNNYPKITVVMPVFNTEAYIDRAVKSILDQTFENFELLVINDGSTDGSLSRLEQWASKDHRLRVISQVNRGASAARNVGISQAKGNFIYFINAVVWKAYAMPWKNRIYILILSLRSWRKYVRIKTLFVLLFKKYTGS
ncbi:MULTISPECIES: glycosyltransferase family 2 protein [Sphingobacterium]|uniref:glycosyltransferase family 2 protein n=1 Tax=Sphingobacterium TaxID=28453 RepID=UPI00257B5507|nr:MULTISPECIES: glycosyltransferase family A protein [Sphingobacterium]